MKSYSEKLKDPRWQKKRLTILKRDKFKCRSCDDETETLHVHHINYDKNKEPWEYKNCDLITLCETCHDTWHKLFNKDLGLYAEYISYVIQLYNRLEQESFERWVNSAEYKRYKAQKESVSYENPF